MASGLYALQASISRNLLQCFQNSCNTQASHTRWRCVAGLALSPQVFGAEQEATTCPNAAAIKLQNLKMKERRDWRELTLEEKQTLYRMSFNQPLHYAVDQPADEWKLILASTFTVMGFMLLGIYFWETKGVSSEKYVGPLSSKSKEENKLSFVEKVEVSA